MYEGFLRNGVWMCCVVGITWMYNVVLFVVVGWCDESSERVPQEVIIDLLFSFESSVWPL